MTISYVEYDLQDGFINNWLTAGPQATPVEDIPLTGKGFKSLSFKNMPPPNPASPKCRLNAAR